MLSLGHELITRLDYDGHTLFLNVSFDTVLRYLQLTADDDFEDAEKVFIAFDMFVENGEDVQDPAEKVEILERILVDVLGFELNKKEEAPGQEQAEAGAPSVKTHDFEKDAGIIYASFLYDYKLDLFQEQGRLHWRQFIALFEHLSEETKMAKVVGFRTAKIPATSSGTSQEQRKFMIDMKNKYRLEEPDENPDRLNSALAGLFSSLKSKALKQ